MGSREASWEVLGLPGGVRGASWEGLGRSWGDLGATFKAVRFRIDLLIDFERQKGAKREAFGEAKWTQNRPQNDTKSKSIFKSEKNWFRIRLGGLLGRFWCIFGAILGVKKHQKCWKTVYFVKNDVFEEDKRSRRVLEQTLVDFGPIWAPKGRPRGAQEGPKTGPK